MAKYWYTCGNRGYLEDELVETDQQKSEKYFSNIKPLKIILNKDL